MARYVNKRKYESRYDMINQVVTEYWVYSEYGEGFGIPKNAFFTTDEIDNICVFASQAGQKISNGAGQT